MIIEGISYVTNYRNQVDAEIRKVGIEKLITNLETQGEKALETMAKDNKDAQVSGIARCSSWTGRGHAGGRRRC